MRGEAERRRGSDSFGWWRGWQFTGAVWLAGGGVAWERKEGAEGMECELGSG